MLVVHCTVKGILLATEDNSGPFKLPDKSQRALLSAMFNNVYNKENKSRDQLGIV